MSFEPFKFEEKLKIYEKWVRWYSNAVVLQILDRYLLYSSKSCDVLFPSVALSCGSRECPFSRF